jgi:signal transduction histidine kinase
MAIPTPPDEEHTAPLSSAVETRQAGELGARHAAEIALAHSREDLRAYVQHLDAAIEQERAHIARELHDELGQRLTALKLDLRWLSTQLAEQGPTPASWTARLDGMTQLIDDTIHEVRALSTELRPQAIEMLGLAAAIADYCTQFEARTGVSCQLQLQPHKRVPAAQKLAVFRVFQEAMTNVTRHSDATQVTVRLFARRNTVLLEVEDNGRGMPAAMGEREHLGLIGMSERAHQLGGSLEIDSSQGRGVRLALSLPLPARRPPA